MGGGLELALACRHRVVSDSPKTRVGLPEVQLGILPAWGGTTRLPRLVGLQAALDLLLTGKRIDAERAQFLVGAQEKGLSTSQADELFDLPMSVQAVGDVTPDGTTRPGHHHSHPIDPLMSAAPPMLRGASTMHGVSDGDQGDAEQLQDRL